MKTSSRFRLRFSLRVLILCTMVAAIAVYLMVQPSRVANQFSGHIKVRDISAARAMFESELNFSHWWVMLEEQAKNEPDREIYVTIEPLELADLIRFRRKLVVHSRTTGLGMSTSTNFWATRRSVNLRVESP